MNFKPGILESRVARARHAATKKCTYKLGRGGFNPSFPLDPAWDKGCSDCSGFVSYVLMTRRDPKPGRNFWLETTAIYTDAIKLQRDGHREGQVFRQIPYPVPGCLVVYGDKNGKQGHIGVVVETWRGLGKPEDYGDDTPDGYTTVECASGLLGRIGKAIRYRKDAQKLFGPKGAIFCVLKDDLV